MSRVLAQSTVRRSTRRWRMLCSCLRAWRVDCRVGDEMKNENRMMWLMISTGVQGEYMLYNWYSTSFTVPSDWSGEKVLLNFGAVDYEATVFVNGKKAGFNRGGYFAFSLDITSLLTSGNNELYVTPLSPLQFVRDKSEFR